MRKTDWSILLCTVLYSAIFYKQNAGLNFLVFTLALSGFLLWIKPAVAKHPHWILATLLALFSAGCVLAYGSDLSILALISCWFYMAGAALFPHSSVLTNLGQGAYSVISSIVFIVIGLFRKSRQKSNGQPSLRLNQVLTFIIPVAIAILFFMLYRISNPLFNRITEKINLDFISLSWVLFTLGGFLLVYGLFRQRRMEELDEWEFMQQGQGVMAAPSTSWNEPRAFLILLLLLNMMLVVINAMDVNYLYLGAGLPAGITHKQFVHHGVGVLILSIILCLAALLYFLRRVDLRNNKGISILFFLLIIQNLMMVASTAMRNSIYIHEALLTYKRIGVYYWLLFAAFGLITMLVKVYKNRADWYLMRINSLLAIIVLSLSAAIDWDLFITNYNLKHVPSLKALDKKYLISLSETNLRQLYERKYQPGFTNDTIWHYQYSWKYSNQAALDQKLKQFLDRQEGKDLRSFNFRTHRVNNEIAGLDRAGIFDTLDLRDLYSPNLSALKRLKSLKALKIGQKVDSAMCSQLNDLPQVHTLELHGAYVMVDSLKRLRYIKMLRLNATEPEKVALIRKENPQLQVVDLQRDIQPLKDEKRNF